MTSRITDISIDDKIWRYIRRNKKFVFSEAMIVTGAKHEYLLSIFKEYEKKGYLKVSSASKSISNRTYIVMKKLDLKVDSIPVYKCSTKSLTPLRKLLSVLQNYHDSEITFSQIEKDINFSRGVLKKLIEQFVSISVLVLCNDKNISRKYHHEKYSIERKKVKALKELYETKQLSKLKQVLEGTEILTDYVLLPNNLPQILKVIKEDEVLTRDELCKASSITRKALTNWWQILKKIGIVVDSYKENPKDRVTYIFSSKRAAIVLKELYKGCYEKEPELRHLWIKK